MQGKIVASNSAEALGMQGSGQIIRLGGREGNPVFDAWLQAFYGMDNPTDLAYLQSIAPTYPNEPDFEPYPYDSSLFYDNDPTTAATYVFDSVVMYALAACEVISQTNSYFIDGPALYEQLFNVRFEGVTGTVALNPETGSRPPETLISRLINFLHEPYNETHVIFKRENSAFFEGGEWIETIPFIYNDGSTNVPSALRPVSLELNYLDRPLRVIGLIMSGLILLLSVALAVWTELFRAAPVVQASQPIFLLLMCRNFCFGRNNYPFEH
jgi:hypothetical protein